MSKIVLANVDTAFSTGNINSNFQKIADALNNSVLYRNNPPNEPNVMLQDLDMNSFNIVNVSEGIFQEITENLIVQVETLRDEVIVYWDASRESADAAGDSASTALGAANLALGGIALSRDWAVKPEDSLVNDGVNPVGYSAFHWASKAAASAALAQVEKIEWRGPWSPATVYQPRQAVYHLGSSWIAKATSIDVEPAANPSWEPLALAGAGVAVATTSSNGIARQATDVEASDGVLNGPVFTTPAHLPKQATELANGLARQATDVEASSGVIGGAVFVNPVQLSSAVSAAPQVQPSILTPSMNGVASVGVEDKFSRGDHVHPTDISIAFTNRVVLVASGEFIAPKTGWYRIKCIGGGAAGGGANKRGGGGGGDTKCGTLTARGGGGGNGSVVGITAAGAGGGGPGEVVEDLIWLEKGEILPVSIGAGGVCSTVDSTAATGLGAAPLLSTTWNLPGMGGIGAQPGLTSGVYDSGGGYGGSGGSGGRNGTGYGGGGGGAAGSGSANSNIYHSPGGAAIDGGMPGANSNATAHQGGNGGPGAVIIEF